MAGLIWFGSTVRVARTLVIVKQHTVFIYGKIEARETNAGERKIRKYSKSVQAATNDQLYRLADLS